jgi:hypothetical protein
MLAGDGHMGIEDNLSAGVDEQGDLQRAYLELDPLGVVGAGIGTVHPEASRAASLSPSTREELIRCSTCQMAVSRWAKAFWTVVKWE